MAGAGETGILAFALITGVARRAIGVHATFSLHRRWRPDTGHIGVSSGSGVTAAGRLVVPGGAGSVRTAGLPAAHSHTLLRDEVAGLVVPTIIVDLTFNVHAGNERVTLESQGADAAGLVVLHAAFGATAAGLRRGQARVQAVLVEALLVQRAVVVYSALSWK